MTVPEEAAAQVLDTLVAAGIKGVLNFTPIQLKGSEKCWINNINIALEIENLFYFVRFAQKDSFTTGMLRT